MRSEEKLMHVVVTLNTTDSRSTNYVLGRIIGAIEMVIVDNDKANGTPLIISDPDELISYIIRFWATKEQMNAIRATLPRIVHSKLAKFQYYRIYWRDKKEEFLEENEEEEES